MPDDLRINLNYDANLINGIKPVDTNYTGEISNELEYNFNFENQPQNYNLYTEVIDPKDLNEEAKTIIIEQLNKQYDELLKEFEHTKKSNGWISGLWDGFKNLTGIGAGSNKTEDELNELKQKLSELEKNPDKLADVYKGITGNDFTLEELSHFINGETNLASSTQAGQSLSKYQEGQKMCVDVVADVVSGIASVAVVAVGTTLGICAAPFTAGASLGAVAASFGLGAATGALVKTAIKASDCIGNEKEYTLSNLGYDVVTGGINGGIAPISNAIGGAAGTGVAKVLGYESLETTAAKTFGAKATQVGAKILINGAEMTTDGALTGGVDGFSRALAEGRIEDIPQDTLNGTINGAIAAPIIGGGFKIAQHTGSRLGKLFLPAGHELIETLDSQALEYVEKGIPISRAQDVSMLTSKYSDRIETLINNDIINKYYISDLAILQEEEYSKAMYLIQEKGFTIPSAIETASLNGEKFDIKVEQLLAHPEKMKREITPQAEKELIAISKKIHAECTQYSDESSRQIEEIFGQSNNCEKITSRVKQEDSMLKKLKQYYEAKEFELDPVNSTKNYKICKKAVLTDAYGSRVQIRSLTADEAKAIVSKCGYDYNEFCELLSKCSMSNNFDLLDENALKALNMLKEAQNHEQFELLKEYFDPTELNNYGNDLSSYLTDSQLEDIADAYYIRHKKQESLTIINKNELKNSAYTPSESDILAGKYNRSDDLSQTIPESLKNATTKNAQKKSGYTSTQLKFRQKIKKTRSGYCELQIRGTEVNTFADVEHIPYDIRKGKITPKDVKYKDVYGIIKNMSEDSYKEYNEYLRQTYDYFRMKELGCAENISKPVLDFSKIVDEHNNTFSQEAYEAITQEGLTKLK